VENNNYKYSEDKRREEISSLQTLIFRSNLTESEGSKK